MDNPIHEFTMVRRGAKTLLRLSEQLNSGRLGAGRAVEQHSTWRAERQLWNWKVPVSENGVQLDGDCTLVEFRSCDWRANADPEAFGLPHERQSGSMEHLP